MLKECFDIFNSKDRPHVSNIIYLVCGLIEFVCFISLISPFHISISHIDNIEWIALNDNEIIVRITFWIVIAYLIWKIVKSCTLKVCDNIYENESKLCNSYVNVYTADDIIELITALFALVFIFSVFIQVYNIETMFISIKASIVYIFIAVKSVLFLEYRFRAHNLTVINDVWRRDKKNESVNDNECPDGEVTYLIKVKKTKDSLRKNSL